MLDALPLKLMPLKTQFGQCGQGKSSQMLSLLTKILLKITRKPIKDHSLKQDSILLNIRNYQDKESQTCFINCVWFNFFLFAFKETSLALSSVKNSLVFTKSKEFLTPNEAGQANLNADKRKVKWLPFMKL